ncbi:S53 family peptidase [Paenibacillus elgii]|uniref:S53 family peptidase n=1 Tax=Paenibacillus elgii TaxID=189691 RepID=UPI000FDA0AFA|nr:S53 family peptidase [Paenibacillus elgii]NEN83506.1 S8/S53 family peptidase [Paenibacillus elgii]
MNHDHSPTGRELSNWVRVPGSERAAVQGSRKVGPADPNEQMSVTVVVRRPAADTAVTSMIEKVGAQPLSERRHLTREEFASTHGANPADLSKVEKFAHEHNLQVKEVNAAAGTMVLSGTVTSFSKAFGVELSTYEHPDFTYRGRIGHVHIPDYLADTIQSVLGLDNRPQASPRFRVLKEEGGVTTAHAGRTSYTPLEVAALYNFPSIHCKDQCIGILELGGGYHPADLQTYFNGLGIPQPNITDVSVGGAANRPTGDPNGPDGEVVLDIEVAVAVTPGAKIAVYFADNSDDGFLNAITTAIHDTRNKPSVISISWGKAEIGWTPQAINAMNQAFRDAAALGVTICCASGDDGSTDRVQDGRYHVDFPASSPYVLACGGTRLESSGSAITQEVVWNEGALGGGATGGGVSDVFDRPDWQANANVPPSANPERRIGRGVPDWAGNADPATGYQILVDGTRAVIGGTSAVAPLFAGLIAIINQKLGHSVGFINPILYNLSAQHHVFHDITSGNNDMSGQNGPYEAQTGWDACTGLGSPDGTKLMNALSEAHRLVSV